MVDTADKNKELYDNIEAIQAKEKANTPATDEEKAAVLAQLNEMANSSMEFDPEHLDSIIAFASNYGNNANAEAILRKAQEQKAKAAGEIPAQDEKQPAENTEKQAKEAEPKDPATVPSYNLYKEYADLKAKENPTEEDQKKMAATEQYVAAVVSNTDPKNVDAEASVGLQDYLDIAYIANPQNKEQLKELQDVVSAQLEIYDQQNGLKDAASKTPEEMKKNEELWANVGIDVKPVMGELDSIMQGLDKEEGKNIIGNLRQMTIYDLKDNAPDEHGAETMQKAMEGNATEFKALVIAEYLKQQAKAEFCEQNKIKPEELDALLMKNAKGEELNEAEKGTLDKLNEHTAKLFERSQNFDGPFTNKEFLKNAVNTTQSQLVSRSVTKESRRSRLMNAPEISPRVEKMNSQFAEKHPKMHKAMNIAKTMGINALRTAAISAALGPVGLTAYSAIKTGKAIRKAYLEYREKEGLDSFSFKDIKGSLKNYASFAKYLKQPENRAQALTLAGQVAATAISGYFTLGGVDTIVNNAGIVGKAVGHAAGLGTEHVADAAVQATQHIDSVGGAIKAGFTKILSSPRRAATMASSLGIGAIKFLSEKHNLNTAHKKLTQILEANGVQVSDKMLASLDAASANPQEFAAKLKELAPNIDEKSAAAALKNADLARKSNPKSAAIGTLAGAAIGLTAASAMEFVHSEVNEIHEAGLAEEGTKVGGNTAKAIEELAASNSNEDWNKGADQRLESFGIDAKNANEMLREMGVIGKDDHHFYRQHELAKLVDGAKLNDEQRTQIQDWANDREARVANLKAYLSEHARHNGVRSGHGGHTAAAPEPNKTVEIDKNLGNVKDGEAKTEVPEEKIVGKAFHVEGVVNRKNELSGDTMANNPKEAAALVMHENGMNGAKRSQFVVKDQYGNETTIKNKITSHSQTTKTTYYHGAQDEKEVVAKEKTKLYKTGSKAGDAKITTRVDIDKDGKMDKVQTIRRADGSEVTYAKMSKDGDRVLTVKDKDGHTTTLSASEKSAKDGSSKSESKAALYQAWKNLKSNSK